MANTQEYKCPCCGGAVAFDSTSQKLKCPYCDTEFDISEAQVDGFVESDMHWEEDAGEEWHEGEAEGVRIYVCKSCGGEILCDENTAATTCPFCGSPVVMTGNVSGLLKPDLVIPFQLDKKAAKMSYEKYLEGKRLLPKVFKDQNHIDEVRGVYVPFWLFDADANADINYRATKVRTWMDRNHSYEETSYYSVNRAGQLHFDAVPVDGSRKMPDDLMESLEPFDLKDAVAFNTAYMAGYMADKYDVDAQESMVRANDRIQKTTEQRFASTVTGYVTVTPENGRIWLTNSRVRYAFYPVWLLNTTWNGQRYTFAMNGQTGKMVGDLPADKGRSRGWFWGITGIGTVVLFLLQYLLRGLL